MRFLKIIEGSTKIDEIGRLRWFIHVVNIGVDEMVGKVYEAGTRKEKGGEDFEEHGAK